MKTIKCVRRYKSTRQRKTELELIIHYRVFGSLRWTFKFLNDVKGYRQHVWSTSAQCLPTLMIFYHF